MKSIFQLLPVMPSIGQKHQIMEETALANNIDWNYFIESHLKIGFTIINRWQHPAVGEIINLEFQPVNTTTERKVSLNDIQCIKCGGIGKASQAFNDTWEEHLDLGSKPGDRGNTLSKTGPAKLVDCLKCSSCGHSWLSKEGIYNISTIHTSSKPEYNTNFKRHIISAEELEGFQNTSTLASSTANGGKRLVINTILRSTGELYSAFEVHHQNKLVLGTNLLEKAIIEYNKY